MEHPSREPQLERRAREIAASYRKWTGRDLGGIPQPGERVADWLFALPLAVVSHGTEPDPILNFGSRKALELWECSWEQLTSMPSRLTAEPVQRDERARLLERVAAHGYIGDYSGIRISRTGKRFRIANATVWNVVDAAGNPAGQAAAFAEWEVL
jgi:hypothetical protein